MLQLLALACAFSAAQAAPSFTIANNEFVQDGKVAHLRAGCIHYSVRVLLCSYVCDTPHRAELSHCHPRSAYRRSTGRIGCSG
jgi:hypothetical protein